MKVHLVMSNVEVDVPATSDKNMWYEMHQNNSGGYYVEPAKRIWIEAESYEAAKSVENSLGLDYNYCECCGERWYLSTSATKTPEYYGTPLNEISELPWDATDRDDDVCWGLLVRASGDKVVLNFNEELGND